MEMPGYEESIGNVFLDPAKLEIAYVPEQLPSREPELDTLAHRFAPALRGVGVCQQIAGPHGSGKTAVAKRFLEIFAEKARKKGRNVKPIYINCERLWTQQAVLCELIRQFKPTFAYRGHRWTELLAVLAALIEKKGAHPLIVLDEVVPMLQDGSSLIDLLARYYECDLPPISLILIALSNADRLIGKATMSGFGHRIIRFEQYEKEHLGKILDQRIELAFLPGVWPQDSRNLFLDTVEGYHDAKRMIRLLQDVGRLAEAQQCVVIIPEHVRAVKLEHDPYDLRELIRPSDPSEAPTFNRHELLALMGIATRLKRRGYIAAREAEDAYQVACEGYGVQWKSHRTYLRFLEHLAMYSVIDRRERAATGGRGTLITIKEMPACQLEDFLSGVLEHSLSPQV